MSSTSVLASPVLNERRTPVPVAGLVEGFRSPPPAARPRVWWHRMNGNVTDVGVTRDLEWMARIGVGGLQAFDVSLGVPKVVDQPQAFMSEAWKTSLHHAVSESQRLGLEFGVASSPGWSETGGPWVTPDDAMKKLAWSETFVDGGTVRPQLAAPPKVTGPYQTRQARHDGVAGPATHAELYRDVMVLACPANAPSPAPDAPSVRTMNGTPIDPALLSDADLHAGAVFPTLVDDQPNGVLIAYKTPRTVRSATVFVEDAATLYEPSWVTPKLQSSEDGQVWTDIVDIVLSLTPSTVSFAPVTAAHFRVLFPPIRDRRPSHHFRAPGAAGAFLIAGRGAPKPEIKLRQLTLSPEARVHQFEAKAGYALARDYGALGSPSGDDAPSGVPIASILDLSDRLDAEGRLDWTAPPGQWRIIRFGWSLTGAINNPAPAEGVGLEADKLDAAAVRRHLEHYVALYADALGPEAIGRSLATLVTDSIETGASNWTPEFASHFRRLRGYDPRPWMLTAAGVVVGSRADSDAFLYDYRRTIADLLVEQHYAEVSRFAHEKGLKLYGEALENGRPSLGDDLAMRRHADIPMGALWVYNRERGPQPNFLADLKGAASVARVYGKTLVAAESLTSVLAPWAFAPADLKPVMDLAFAMGVNRPVIHTSVHQPLERAPGLTLMIVGQHFNRHETWAEMARPWMDYLARSSFLLQQGRPVSDVAYFHGEDTPLVIRFGDGPVADAPDRYGFDFVNGEIVRELRVVRGRLFTPAGADYRALYLGEGARSMTLPTLEALETLVDAGAVIIGPPPEGSPSLADDAGRYQAIARRLWAHPEVTSVGRGKVVRSRSIEGALAALRIAPDFDCDAEPGAILHQHRTLEDGDLYFLSHRRAEPASVEARFRVTGRRPSLWRADTGEIQPLPFRRDGAHTVVRLDLAADDAVFVVFAERDSRRRLDAAPAPVTTPLLTIAGPWEAQFQAGRGAPDRLAMERLSDLSTSKDAGVRYFSGTATYRTTFNLTDAPSPLSLDLGAIGDVAQVLVNGRDLGVVWKPPYRVPLSDAVRAGENSLEIRVANLWVNRLIGDAQAGAEKIAFTTAPTYDAAAPLRPSGLLGPVQILRSEKGPIRASRP
ncbi:glycosyl hydrolase [Brevundimonas sp. MYb33]|nr:glycosyl hydrolase [Brevundimonas sp. MYb33]